MADEKTLIAEEKAKRKALARVRLFYVLIGLDVTLVIYIVLQVLLLIGK